MEIRNLMTFARIAEVQSFSKSAEQLGYSQSAVTMQIKQLEEELHAQLFERIGKQIRLTQAGERLPGKRTACNPGHRVRRGRPVEPARVSPQQIRHASDEAVSGISDKTSERKRCGYMNRSLLYLPQFFHHHISCRYAVYDHLIRGIATLWQIILV